MHVLRSLATGWLPGLLMAAAAPLRPERGRHPSRAAVRVDGGAMTTTQRLRRATARTPGHDGRRALWTRCKGLANTLQCQRDLAIRWLLALLMCSCAIGHAATVEYLIVGGGGGGGGGTTVNGAGGGGAGGVASGSTAVSAQSVTITVGAGGAGGTAGTGVTGSTSAFGSLTAGGGGGGGTYGAAGGTGWSGATVGGSGGGGGRDSGTTTSGAKGIPAGNGASTFNSDGGVGIAYPWGSAGGGGGAGAVGNSGGYDAGTLSGTFSRGGAGVSSSISGVATWYGGGGGGAWQSGAVKAQGGQGGGGSGANNYGAGAAGVANTGGGGGGGQFAAGGAGGSGIVILRYKTDGSDGIHAGATTGGTKTTSGIYTIHTFTASGTFTVATAGVEYLVVGGGGGGGGGYSGGNWTGGGGGGGGGYRSSVAGESSGGGNGAESALAVGLGAHPIVVGAGGSGGWLTNDGTNGSDSYIQNPSLVDLVRSTGGGGGAGAQWYTRRDGLAGGSGGGAAGRQAGSLAGSGTASQGYNGGGAGINRGSGGGGGAGGLGVGSANAGNDGYYNYAKTHGGTGGPGVFSSITGSSIQRGGGGGGGADETFNYLPGIGGLGGGGAGGTPMFSAGTSGTANTGGGGGGGTQSAGGNGGSGIVVLRYKTDGSDGIDAASTTGGTKTTSGIYTVHTFTSSGTFTVSASAAAPHHLEIQHASGTGLTCTPSTVTVKACADAACSTAYTSGVSGTLQATGGSVNWPATAAFSIASGSSSTTVSLQATTTTATVLGVASSTPAASNALSCNFGSPACTFTAADAGFVFDVPNHVAEVAQTVSISAVRKSDSSAVCTPAFASATKAVTFKCGYTNPTTGTLPVRVGGTALNSTASAAAACDAGGRAVSLAFNASGVASTTVQYADVGNMLLSASYSGSAGTGEASLVMNGSDSFIAAPGGLTFSGITSGPIKAGSSFAATVSAVNNAGATTPNHGRETSAEGATLAWVRIQPTGSGAVNGSFSGSLGAFSGGSASASNLTWTEVGRGDLVARSTNTAGYLGTGLRAFGASSGTSPVSCAAENANCVIPGGTTATVYYGENGSYFAKAGETGTVACNSSNFGDPLSGTSKRCWYVAAATTTGSVGDVIPHRFTVAATNACGTFSYAGQPITTTVTAQNAAGATTINFNGTATTTPSFAQAVTLADANGLGVGTLSGASIAAGAFSAGVASATPSYSFTSKTTAPQSLVLRATNGASGTSLISSQGYAEPTLPLRSGRLRLGNAFGRASAALQLPVVTEHWGGSAWQLNSADSCTALAGSSVALSNPRGATGAASTATSSAGAVAISGGNGTLTLAAPSPAGSSLSLDLAVNLGSAGTDQSCNTSKPTTTGAALPWLRAQNGSCAATADRDPAARASFGIFAPETRKTVHVRDLY
jgi:hypothetical protein